jgi:hypothetical protein
MSVAEAHWRMWTSAGGEFSKVGLALEACGNTLKAQNVTVKDLLPTSSAPIMAALSVSPSSNRRATSTCGRERPMLGAPPPRSNA